MNASTVLLIVIALIGGVAVALQAQFVSTMERMVGTLGSVFITYVGGAIVISICLLAMRGGDLSGLQTIPRYCLTAGALGLVVIASVSYTVPRLGLANALTLLVTSQLLFGFLVDHFGLFGALARPVETYRVIGIATILLGTWLVLK